MRKFCAVCIVFLASFSSSAQETQLYTGLQEEGTVLEAEPSSSLDLLRQANKKYEISVGTPTNRPVSSKKTQTNASTATVTAAPSAPVQSSSEPVTQAVPMPSVNVPEKTANVQVPVQSTTAPDADGSVQAVATTTTKTLSPSAIKRLEEAKEKRTQTTETTPVPTAAVTSDKQPQPTELEKDIERFNGLLPEGMQEAAKAESEEEAAADAELEYAVRMLEKSKETASNTERTIPPPAAKNKPSTVPTANKKFNPNSFRPGVEWSFSKSTHFDIYTQKTSGVGAANMSMTFEGAYETLRRFIPWMLSGRVRVFVYQDHNSYLKYEPEAKAWTRALAYPTRGEIVVYDEPGKKQELKEVFTHELTHIFTQNFFDKHRTGRIMTPTWLDEGLAVLVEDQAYNGSKGGPWNHDYQTLNLQRDKSQEPAPFTSHNMFGSYGSSLKPRSNGVGARNGIGRRGRPVVLTPFEEFMKEGSLEAAEGKDKTQQWYLQAYLMVRFLLNPSGSASPSNRMQFEQFTRLLAEGEAVRNPSTGFLVKDAKGKVVYQPYSTEKALSRAYHYNTIGTFEDAFWKWMKK